MFSTLPNMDDRTTIGTPKPTKADRPNLIRRREKKKKDIQFQKEAGGEGTCENCQQWKPLCGHHIIGRTNRATRHDPRNRLQICYGCHSDVHSLSAAKLLAKYPRSELRREWEERARTHKIPILPE